MIGAGRLAYQTQPTLVQDSWQQGSICWESYCILPYSWHWEAIFEWVVSAVRFIVFCQAQHKWGLSALSVHYMFLLSLSKWVGPSVSGLYLLWKCTIVCLLCYACSRHWVDPFVGGLYLPRVCIICSCCTLSMCGAICEWAVSALRVCYVWIHIKQVFQVKKRKTRGAPMGCPKLELLGSNGVHICHAI